MSQILLPYTRNCFVCGADNPSGLRLRFAWDAGHVVSVFQPGVAQEGYRGIVHGGIIASALDETMFWAAAYTGRAFYVSVEMAVRYQQKVAVGPPYRLVARVTREQRRIAFVEGELRDEAGRVLATATGKFFPLKPDAVPLSHEDFVDDPATLAPGELWPPPEPGIANAGGVR